MTAEGGEDDVGILVKSVCHGRDLGGGRFYVIETVLRRIGNILCTSLSPHQPAPETR
jgi:hypothetical protein